MSILKEDPAGGRPSALKPGTFFQLAHLPLGHLTHDLRAQIHKGHHGVEAVDQFGPEN